MSMNTYNYKSVLSATCRITMHIICYVQNWLNRYIIYIFLRVIQSIKIGAGRFFSHSRNILDKLMDTHRSMMFDRRRMFGHVIRWKAFFLLKHWNIYIYFLIKRIFFLLTNGYSTPKLIHCQFTSINQLKTWFLLFVFFFFVWYMLLCSFDFISGVVVNDTRMSTDFFCTAQTHAKYRKQFLMFNHF